MNLSESFSITGRVKVNFRAHLLNAFNSPQYTVGHIADVGFTPVANLVRANNIREQPVVQSSEPGVSKQCASP